MFEYNLVQFNIFFTVIISFRIIPIYFFSVIVSFVSLSLIAVMYSRTRNFFYDYFSVCLISLNINYNEINLYRVLYS